MDRNTAKSLRSDLKEALSVLEDTVGMRVEIAPRSTFDEDSVTFKVTLRDADALDPKARDLDLMLSRGYLSDIDAKRGDPVIFSLNGHSTDGRLVGYNMRARKRPFEVEAADGKTYLFDDDNIKRALARAKGVA